MELAGNSELTGFQDRIIEIQNQGYCVLKDHFGVSVINACRAAFWPRLMAYLKIHGDEPESRSISPFSPDAIRAALSLVPERFSLTTRFYRESCEL